ncbi:DUF423 domain-containing protein [Paenibacillus sp. IHBB 10380]|uniref:DUF423 domain-containing protein n=1 Tax=Paenibacillus sp. IHBB 10380 TaxID=1566358 RepID=UPI0005CF9C74|nr:DUF423 domain-containing protein [Paenibacillus sp. IHBB 10380]AJS59630.1 membrane protein [Paenibacillus sp. IHBB 10380]
MQRTFIQWGTVLMALSVAIGAFGAHLLEPRIGKDALEVYETGVQYHMIHGLALILVGITVGQRGESKKLNVAGWMFIVGVIVFSGSLYILSISGIKVLGAITPLGGIAFIIGWLYFMSDVLRRGKSS